MNIQLYPYYLAYQPNDDPNNPPILLATTTQLAQRAQRANLVSQGHRILALSLGVPPGLPFQPFTIQYFPNPPCPLHPDNAINQKIPYFFVRIANGSQP